MKTSTLTICLILFLAATPNYSCNRNNESNNGMESIINKEISVRMFETVYKGDEEYTWKEFRKKFRNISIVYLQDGCAPCYPKFINWHKRMEQIAKADDYTVLFVINARDYANFIRNARIYGEVDERYYHVMDPNNRFLMNNSSIPRTVLDRSLLIDRDNRIKMVGEPFFNADMTKVFHIVTGVDN